MTARRVLLIGATGTFGSRLAALLAGMPSLDLVLAARGVEAVKRLCDQLRPGLRCAGLSAVAFDRLHPEGLATLRPWLVIDAAGPFQSGDTRLAIAAVEAGAHYIDLADGRAFIARFPSSVAAAARAAGTLAVTGASSTPALSHAAVEAITAGWRAIDEIHVAILPGAQAPRGLSVVQAILSYVGKPVRVFRDGRWQRVPGWSSPRRLDIPGLGRRWASICDTPDLDLLPQRFPVRRTALFTAGLEVSAMHLGLAALSLLVRWHLVTSLVPLARTLQVMAGLFAPFGSDRGGMIVEAWGLDEAGERVRARWTLLAQANAGPYTPAAPAAAFVRALCDGTLPQRGAVTAAGLLPLPLLLRELAALPITTWVDEGHPESAALFRRLLGRRFQTLPPAVRVVHDGLRPMVFSGHAMVRAGRGLVPRILQRLLGLPRSGPTSVEVQIAPDPTGERWTRRFGPSQFASRLTGRATLGTFEERFGLLRFAFSLAITDTGVAWQRIGWSLAGLRLPLAFAPRMHAAAEDIGGRYRFRVVVAHPWTGLLFAYRGTLGVGLGPSDARRYDAANLRAMLRSKTRGIVFETRREEPIVPETSEPR